MEEQKVGFIKRIDLKAESKGKAIAFLWQFTKFLVVSLLTTGVQLLLVNIMFFALKDWKPDLPNFMNAIFSESSVGVGNNNWGYVLPFFVSNLIANTIGYFLNKSKTFRSDAPWWHFVIYIVTLFLLIVFATWLQGVIANALISTNINFFVKTAPTIAAMAAGTLQFITLFPLQKYVLLREKKEGK